MIKTSAQEAYWDFVRKIAFAAPHAGDLGTMDPRAMELKAQQMTALEKTKGGRILNRVRGAASDLMGGKMY